MAYFEWDENKNKENIKKHQVSFSEAKKAFLDPDRVIAEDIKHSTDEEKRYFCYGKVDGYILTVRFTYRNRKIRVFGAGFWRGGRKYYEKTNKIH